jgi:2-methylisocitrate lyase-like PEP mutase family enzyme
MKQEPSRRARLRALIAAGRTLAVPGATDAISAKLIEAHGFEAVYIGSYATAASRFGLPDTGLLSLDELAAQTKTIADAVSIPVIADAEGGFHDAANIWRSVRAFEQAGACAIHIEDHAGPGKHTDLPQSLRPAEETAARIRAAVAARSDPDFLIVARSDACWVNGDFEDTVRRLSAYAAAGADLVFPTLVSAEQVAEVRRRVGKPVMIVDIPGASVADEERCGAAVVLYYGLSALVAYSALDRALAEFRAGRDANRVSGYRERVKAFEAFMGYGETARRARGDGSSSS